MQTVEVDAPKTVQNSRKLFHRSTQSECESDLYARKHVFPYILFVFLFRVIAIHLHIETTSKYSEYFTRQDTRNLVNVVDGMNENHIHTELHALVERVQILELVLATFVAEML